MTCVRHKPGVAAAPPRTVRAPDEPCLPGEEPAAYSSVVPISGTRDPHDSHACLAMRVLSRAFRSTGEIEGEKGVLLGNPRFDVSLPVGSQVHCLPVARCRILRHERAWPHPGSSHILIVNGRVTVCNPLPSASWIIPALSMVGFSLVARIGKPTWRGLSRSSRRRTHLSTPVRQRLRVFIL